MPNPNWTHERQQLNLDSVARIHLWIFVYCGEVKKQCFTSAVEN